jgi:NifU-like protein involved in Fe-S cluster formation
MVGRFVPGITFDEVFEIELEVENAETDLIPTQPYGDDQENAGALQVVLNGKMRIHCVMIFLMPLYSTEWMLLMM